MSCCIALEKPTFTPAMRLINSITNAFPAVVQTAVKIDTIAQPNIIVLGTHGYITGAKVRLDIPEACGMQEANGLVGSITVIDATTFSIDIDTTHFTVFAIPTNPPPQLNTCAMVVPMAEDANIYTKVNEPTIVIASSNLSSAVQNVIPK